MVVFITILISVFPDKLIIIKIINFIIIISIMKVCGDCYSYTFIILTKNQCQKQSQGSLVTFMGQ